MAVTALSPASRLLQRAQELGQLDQIIRMYVEGQSSKIHLVLAGMQCGRSHPVEFAELDAARLELTELVEQVFESQTTELQDLLHQPNFTGDMNYRRAFEMLAAGAPESAVYTFLTGWMMGLSAPHPYVRARVLTRAMVQRAQALSVMPTQHDTGPFH